MLILCGCTDPICPRTIELGVTAAKSTPWICTRMDHEGVTVFLDDASIRELMQALSAMLPDERGPAVTTDMGELVFPDMPVGEQAVNMRFLQDT